MSAARNLLPQVETQESLAVAMSHEPGYVTISVKLSGGDLKNVRRILEGKFEPDVDAWLVVKVRRQP